jgi:hypothetical protein
VPQLVLAVETDKDPLYPRCLTRLLTGGRARGDQGRQHQHRTAKGAGNDASNARSAKEAGRRVHGERWGNP